MYGSSAVINTILRTTTISQIYFSYAPLQFNGRGSRSPAINFACVYRWTKNFVTMHSRFSCYFKHSHFSCYFSYLVLTVILCTLVSAVILAAACKPPDSISIVRRLTKCCLLFYTFTRRLMNVSYDFSWPPVILYFARPLNKISFTPIAY